MSRERNTAAKSATSRGVIGTFALSGDAGLAKVNTIGPLVPVGASWMCADCGEARLCVHCTASDVASLLRSAEQLAVALVLFGGTTWAPVAVKFTVSTVRGRICPRISPAGRPAVWTLM